MSFNIWNDVALYKLWNPKNKILDLNLTKKEKEKKNANRPRPYLLHFLSHGPKKKKKKTETISFFPSLFLLDPIGRLNILVQLIEKLNERKEKLIKEKENYKYGTHSTSCCWHMTHDI